jgi:hypothetical protein
MIVPDQGNIKVHFAGSEGHQHFNTLRAANIKYSLFSAFSLVADRVGIKGVSYAQEIGNTPMQRKAAFRHVIMDSGLFTLMFGALKGKKPPEFVDRWYNALVDFTLERGYDGTAVEVDCQKVLGVDAAWHYRERMRDELPNTRIINVFHIEDGKKGLDRLIEFSDYIALSAPELRFAGKFNQIHRLADYIKTKKPEIDIHLLGMTDTKMLRRLRYCTSADSTSWASGCRYGKVHLHNGEVGHITKFKDEYWQKYADAYQAYSDELGCKIYSLRTDCIQCFQAEQLKHRYAKFAGCQE